MRPRSLVYLGTPDMSVPPLRALHEAGFDIRLVVTKPFPPGAPDSLKAALGDHVEVRQIDELSVLVTGSADATTLATVSRWCEENEVLPESLTLGTRNLEDVFLELTGRTLAR